MSDAPFDIPDVPEAADRGKSSGGSGDPGNRRWPWLLVGIALGVAAALLVPRYLAPHLPAPFRPGELRVQGPVLAEQREEDRLLLTVETEQGAMLATFRRQVAEIALLVDEGDTVTLGLQEYAPFVEEPRLVGVFKDRRRAGAGAADTAGARPIQPDTLSQPASSPVEIDTQAVESPADADTQAVDTTGA